jgi:hypothetical protein
MLAMLGMPMAVLADDDHGHGDSTVLVFESTAMLASSAPDPAWPAALGWPPNGTSPSVKGLGAKAWMTIRQKNGRTDMDFYVTGARPNTLYTIWTVFAPLNWCSTPGTGCPEKFNDPINAGWGTKPGFTTLDPAQFGPLKFYAEGGIVAPTASMAKAFTSGMGLDPGATFYTNRKGEGEIHLKLDYNLLGATYDDGPPVGNSTTVAQCAVAGVSNGAVVPGPPLTYKPTSCPPVTLTLNGAPVTTTPRFTTTSSWLRKFIIQVSDPAKECANYDPTFPASIFWQCIDPATVDPKTGTGLPRVWRFPFDHFRLAAHPDELTHGFIGGSAWEHTIDMVGRRCKLDPRPAGTAPCP